MRCTECTSSYVARYGGITTCERRPILHHITENIESNVNMVTGARRVATADRSRSSVRLVQTCAHIGLVCVVTKYLSAEAPLLGSGGVVDPENLTYPGHLAQFGCYVIPCGRMLMVPNNLVPDP